MGGDEDVRSSSVAQTLDDTINSNSIFASLATPVRQSPARRALAFFPFAPSPYAYNQAPSEVKHNNRQTTADDAKMAQYDEACYIDCDVRFDMIAKFPAEVTAYIFTFFDTPTDLVATSEVSRTWCKFSRDPRNWQQLYLNLSDIGWNVLPNVEQLWSTNLLHAYEQKWRTEQPETEQQGASRTKDEEQSKNDNIIASIHRSALQGPVDWFLLYKARRALKERWGLPLVPTKFISQSEADEIEESQLSSDDPAVEFLEEYRGDPTASAQVRSSAGVGFNNSNRNNDAAMHQRSLCTPDVKYLYGHQDSIYCVRLDSTPFELRSNVEQNLAKAYVEAPLYDPCTSLGIGSRGKIYSGSRDRSIKIWDGDSGLLLHTLNGHSGSVLCLEYDEDVLLSGSSDKTVILWDLTPMYSGSAPRERKVLTGHTDGVLDISMSERWVITCGKDSTVRVYDRTADFNCVHVYRQHRGPVNAGSLAMHEGKICAVTASGEGSMQLWQVESGALLRTFRGHQKGLACVKFANDVVVSGSNDFTVRVWSARTGECLAVCRDHCDLVRAIAFDAKRSIIVSAGYDGCVKLFDVQRILDPQSAVVQGGITITALADVPSGTTTTTTTIAAAASTAMLRREEGRSMRNGSGRLFDVQMDATRILSCGENNRICVRDFARESPIMRLFA